jgi:hypothetical protein
MYYVFLMLSLFAFRFSLFAFRFLPLLSAFCLLLSFRPTPYAFHLLFGFPL